MHDRSLFERLEAATHPARLPAPFSASALSESVINNIRRIFNARQGSCETRPDYGVPDLNDVVRMHLEAVPAIERAVRTQIELFEPRLRDVQVRFEPDSEDPLSLGFAVTATLVGENEERIRFDTRLGDDRRLRVRS